MTSRRQSVEKDLSGQGPALAEFPGTIEELDEHISTLRENLRELIEQAAAHSGAADDELTSQRIEEQEALLETLTKRRAELASAALGEND